MRLNHVLAIGVLSLAVVSAPAQAPNPRNPYQGPGRYEIENAASGKVLDLNRQDQRTVAQWSRAGLRSQQWDIQDAGNGYVTIRSAATGLAIDVDGGRARDGARVITSQPTNSQSQLWKIESHGEGKVRFTSALGKSLDLPHGLRDDGVEYETWSSAGQDNQRFRLVWISGPVPPDQNTFRRGDNDRRGDDDRRRDNDRRGNDESRAYNRGYRTGSEDFRAHLRRTYVRHKGEYDSQWEEAFIEGYYDGYDAARPDTSALRADERDTYNDAFRLGQKDSREGREPNYMRYSNQVDPRFSPVFRRGYNDGYYSPR